MPKLSPIVRCLFFVIAVGPLTVRAEQKSIDELRARADAASPSDCARVCMDVAKQLVVEGGRQLTNGDTAPAMKTVEDAVRYAENGGHSAVSTHRRLKNTEIDLREMIRRLSGMKQSLDVDQRPVIDEHITRLEKLRDELLAAMFGSSKKILEHK